MAILNNQRVDKNRKNWFQTCPSTIINHQNHGKPGVLNFGQASYSRDVPGWKRSRRPPWGLLWEPAAGEVKKPRLSKISCGLPTSILSGFKLYYTFIYHDFLVVRFNNFYLFGWYQIVRGELKGIDVSNISARNVILGFSGWGCDGGYSATMSRIDCPKMVDTTPIYGHVHGFQKTHDQVWYPVLRQTHLDNHLISSYIILYHVISCYVILYHLISCYIILYHLISCYIMLYHLISSYIMLYHVISSYIILYHVI